MRLIDNNNKSECDPTFAKQTFKVARKNFAKL